MNGMTRLREFAATLEPELRDIAGQIEMEAHPAGEREAIEWVREHGGIDEIEKRLMPEGMEWMIEVWPRFEDSEPVRIGDEVVDEKAGAIYRVSEIAFSDGYGTCLRYEDPRDSNSYNFIDGLEPGERVKRPAPKVLDAEGVEIRVGDTVYHVKDGSEMTVYGIEGEWLVVSVGGRVRHDIVTHRAPVLAADGRPLREGETVYKLDDDRPYTLKQFDGEHVYINAGGSSFDIWTFPNKLTHERPVLDADGKECNVGDDVWWTCNKTGNFRIIRIDENGRCAIRDDDGDEPCDMSAPPTELTHGRPVLDADGAEIRVGDTVYLLPGDWCDKFPLNRCREWDVMKVLDLSPNHDTGRIMCEAPSSFVLCYPYPSQLTHRAPVLAADGRPIRKGETVWRDDGQELEVLLMERATAEMCRDLVRRARELAERGE